jgi:hypothetical protein
MRRFSLLFIGIVLFSGVQVSPVQAQEEIPRVLLMDLKNNGLDENLVKTINSLLTVNMTNYTQFNVMSGNDVKQLVALEMEKQNMGCTDDGSCLAEIAGAMGATLVIFGDAGKIGNVMLINLSLFNAEEGRSMSRVSIQAVNLDQIPEKMGPTLDKLMAPVLDTPDTAAAKAPPSPAPVAASPKKVAAAEPKPTLPVAEKQAPAVLEKPNYLWPMVTAGTGLVMAIGGGAIVANIYGDIQTIENATTRLTDSDDPSTIDWDQIETKQQSLSNAAIIFDMGAVLAVSGLAFTAGGMIWGVLEKKRFETPATE